ncbi:MAG: M56 family metallopeptidase, partial [Acidobacteriota bacterium]
MNWENFINSKIVENLGWTLLHSIWQIALIAFVLFVLLKIFRAFSANLRYVVSVFALCLIVVLSVITFVQLAVNSSANDLQIKNLNSDYTKKINKEYLSAGGFSTFSKNDNQIVELTDEKTFISIKNLRNLFSKNLPAVLPVLVGLWFLGVMLFALRLIGGVWQIHKYKTCEVSVPNCQWMEKFDALCAKLEITQTVKFLQSNLIETPVVIGWLKPVILVPASVFLQISPQQLETILAHELIHIRRYDALVNLAQSLIEILFFYHPCAWWISSLIRMEREFAADESVIEIMENSHIIYASALANLEEIRQTAKITAPPVLVAA